MAGAIHAFTSSSHQDATYVHRLAAALTAAVDRRRRVLASADLDGAVRLCDVASRSLLRWDGVLWTHDATALTSRVCAAVGYGLTRFQWRSFVVDQRYHDTCPA